MEVRIGRVFEWVRKIRCIWLWVIALRGNGFVSRGGSERAVGEDGLADGFVNGREEGM